MIAPELIFQGIDQSLGTSTGGPMDDNELTEYLWPIVREIIKTAIENNQNLIVEGCYIPFDWQPWAERPWFCGRVHRF